MTNILPASARDPLLFGTTWLLRIMMGLLILGAIALVIALPFLWYFDAQVLAEIAKEEPKMAGITSIAPLLALLAAAAVACGIAVQFVRTLLAMIQTVKDGDPFIADNAKRLETMGWLAVALQILGLVVGAAAMWAHALIDDVEGDFDISLSGVVLVLLLFILARVFRAGAAMRDELEGTV
jgi:hypothetical protein